MRGWYEKETESGNDIKRGKRTSYYHEVKRGLIILWGMDKQYYFKRYFHNDQGA